MFAINERVIVKGGYRHGDRGTVKQQTPKSPYTLVKFDALVKFDDGEESLYSDDQLIIDKGTSMRIKHEPHLHIGHSENATKEPKPLNQPSLADQLNDAVQGVKMINGVSDSMIDEDIKDAKAIEFPGMQVMALCVELKNGMYVTEFSHPNDGEDYELRTEFEKAKKKATEKIRVLLEYHNKEMQIQYPHILKEKEKAPWEN